jgi:hypothetical protein
MNVPRVSKSFTPRRKVREGCKEKKQLSLCAPLRLAPALRDELFLISLSHSKGYDPVFYPDGPGRGE